MCPAACRRRQHRGAAQQRDQVEEEGWKMGASLITQRGTFYLATLAQTG